MSVEAVALRWLIDQGTFPVVAARWSASAGPWATFGHTYGLQHTPAAAAEGKAGPRDSEGPGDQATEAVEAGAKAAGTAAAVVPGAPSAFIPGVDGALFQVVSFLDTEDVAGLSKLCGLVH